MFEQLKEFMSNLTGESYAISLLEEAKSLMSEGQYSSALTRLNTSIEASPSLSSPYYYIARIYAIHDELDSALNYINKCLEVSLEVDTSNDSLALYYDMLGEILQGRADVSGAIKAFDKSFNLRTSSFVENPNNSTVFHVGICYFILRNLPSAHSACLRAIALNPDNPIVYSLMGDICNALMSYASAIEYYEKAIALAPEWDFNYPLNGLPVDNNKNSQFLYVCKVNQGFSYSKIEDDSMSLKCNEEAYSIYQNDATAPINLADLYADKDANLKVRKFLEIGIPLIDPENERRLISTLLNFDVLKYREVAISLLRKHNKISEDEYEQSLQYLKKLQEKNLSVVQSDRQPNSITNIGELIMGSKSNQNLSNSGSMGNYVGGNQINDSHDSIGRDKIEVGHDQINTYGQDVSDFISELQKIKGEIIKAQKDNILDEETATNMEKHIDVAIKQSSTDNPDKGKILNGLDRATDIAKTVSKFVDAAKPITNALIAAVGMAAKFL